MGDIFRTGLVTGFFFLVFIKVHPSERYHRRTYRQKLRRQTDDHGFNNVETMMKKARYKVIEDVISQYTVPIA